MQIIMNVILGGLAFMLQKVFQWLGELTELQEFRDMEDQVKGFRNMLQYYTPKIEYMKSSEVASAFKNIDKLLGLDEAKADLGVSFKGLNDTTASFTSSWSEKINNLTTSTDTFGFDVEKLDLNTNLLATSLGNLNNSISGRSGNRPNIGTTLPGGGSAFGGSPYFAPGFGGSLTVKVEVDNGLIARSGGM
jgi:hypothetical protein